MSLFIRCVRAYHRTSHLHYLTLSFLIKFESISPLI
nr:MAG TPA: hypothetical protein [Caudoviricetes sp.]